jgi:hypothetical protein
MGCMKIHKDSGNALWFILLAIALLAALTFAVTRSSDTSEQTNVTEHDTIAASEIMRTAKGIEEAVSRFRLNGMPENDISFYTSDALTAYYNPNCGTRPDCQVFGAGGGGISYQGPDSSLNDGTPWIVTSDNDVAAVGTTAPDLLLILPNVNPGVCIALNRALKTTEAAANDDIGFTPYTGSFPDAAVATIAGNGARAGCQNNTGGAYKEFYYHVLIPR